MPWCDLVWDDWNVTKMTKHGVSLAEFEQAYRAAEKPRAVRQAGGQKRETYLGGGRELLLVVQRVDRETVRPITAFEER